MRRFPSVFSLIPFIGYEAFCVHTLPPRLPWSVIGAELDGSHRGETE